MRERSPGKQTAKRPRTCVSSTLIAALRPSYRRYRQFPNGIRACRLPEAIATGSGALAASPGEGQGSGRADCHWHVRASPAPRGGGRRASVLRVL